MDTNTPVPIKFGAVETVALCSKRQGDISPIAKPTTKQVACKEMQGIWSPLQGTMSPQSLAVTKARQIVCEAKKKQIIKAISQHKVLRYEWRKIEQYAKGKQCQWNTGQTGVPEHIVTVNMATHNSQSNPILRGREEERQLDIVERVRVTEEHVIAMADVINQMKIKLDMLV